MMGEKIQALVLLVMIFFKGSLLTMDVKVVYVCWQQSYLQLVGGNSLEWQTNLENEEELLVTSDYKRCDI
jgi:hypothetical protein